jgi:hypothetical protein
MDIAIVGVVGVLISMGLGAFWYSPKTPTGRLHMRYLGFDKLSKEEQDALIEREKPHMWKTYLGQMVLSLLTSVATVFIVSMSMQNGVPMSMALLFPLVNWLCFSVPAVGQNVLWGTCPREIAWQKFISDSAYVLVMVVAVGFVTALFA